MTTLPKFSGDDAKCPKCGFTHDDKVFLSRVSTAFDDNRLKRVCPRCGYSWYEGCLDAEQPAECSGPPKPMLMREQEGLVRVFEAYSFLKNDLVGIIRSLSTPFREEAR